MSHNAGGGGGGTTYIIVTNTPPTSFGAVGDNNGGNAMELYQSNRIPEELIKIFMASNRGEVIETPPENGYAFQMFRRGKPVPHHHDPQGLAIIAEDDGSIEKSTTVYPSNAGNENNIWRRRSLFRKSTERDDHKKRGFLSRAFRGGKSRKRSKSPPVCKVDESNGFEKGSSRHQRSHSLLRSFSNANLSSAPQHQPPSTDNDKSYHEQPNHRNKHMPMSPSKSPRNSLNKFNVFRLVRTWSQYKSNKSKGETIFDLPHQNHIDLPHQNHNNDAKQMSQDQSQPQQHTSTRPPPANTNEQNDAILNRRNNMITPDSSHSVTETCTSSSTPWNNASYDTEASSVTKVLDNTNRRSIIDDTSQRLSWRGGNVSNKLLPGNNNTSIRSLNDNISKRSLKSSGIQYRPPVSSDAYTVDPCSDNNINTKDIHVDKNPRSECLTDIIMKIDHISPLLSPSSVSSIATDQVVDNDDSDNDRSCSLQEYFDRIIEARGYSTETFATLSTAYHNDATPLQEASYSSKTVKIVKTGKADELRTMLSCGLSPCPSNYYGESLLHIACRMGNEELIRVMFECGAIVQMSDDVGRTPLHNACWAKEAPNFRVVELLLEKDKFLMQLTDSRGSTPLSYVREENWPEWKAFLDRVKDLFWPDGRQLDQKSKRLLYETPVLARLEPNTFPLKDPPNALNLELARMVAVGTIAPEDAMLLQDEDFEDSLDGDDDDEDDDSDGESCCSFTSIRSRDIVFGTSNDSIRIDSDHNSVMTESEIEEMLTRIASSVLPQKTIK